MPDAPRTFVGEPGTTWTNDTERVKYQFVAALVHTCGVCLQYHMMIGPWWPLPLHHGCGKYCRQYPIAPGSQAPHAFVDFREVLDNMSYQSQMTAIGASNYALLKAKVLKWDEIVTKWRVRTLRETISLYKIPLKTAIKAGVPKRAYVAWADAFSDEAEAVRAHRAKLISDIKGAGVSQEALVDALSRGLVSRSSVVAPGVSQSMAPLVAKRGGDMLTGELAAITARVAAGAALRKKPPEPPPGQPPAAQPVKPPPAPKGPPAPSTASITDLPSHYETASTEVAGRVLTKEELTNLAGLPDGKVTVHAPRGIAPRGVARHWIELRATNDQSHASRSLLKKGEHLVLTANEFEVAENAQGKGIGADVFGRMVDQARKLGADRIETLAAKGEAANGYYTWPRFGYDAKLEHARIDIPGTPLSRPITDFLPESLSGATRVSDLMMTAEGRAWWKANGVEMNMTFDLKEGSRSRAIWDAYQLEKAKPAE
jgi:GNAT superfamily N-acetyltransferase